MELYKKYRPRTFKEVVGQPEAIKTLKALGKAGQIPQVILFSGPSGSGKTTLARILRKKLKCGDADFMEIDGATNRGIEEIRSLKQRLGLAPMSGKSRVICLDECHALTSDAQSALLKTLEDTPKGVYFILCTTDPGKLKPTIITRCTEIKLQRLGIVDLIWLISTVYHAETGEEKVDGDVIEAVAEAADGSARKALVILQQIINIPDNADQLTAIAAADMRKAAIEVARALLRQDMKWPAMVAVLQGIDWQLEDAEGMRYMILSYMTSVMLGKGAKNLARAATVVVAFSEPFYNTKKAGFIVACYDVIVGE